jgi:hypothetical protein
MPEGLRLLPALLSESDAEDSEASDRTARRRHWPRVDSAGHRRSITENTKPTKVAERNNGFVPFAIVVPFVVV